jgi:hypothetical protein
MKEILIIARNFPPYAPLGYVIRMLKLCKFFPALGFKPVVVTVDKNPGRVVDPGKDPLLKEIAETTDIFYVPEDPLIRFVEKMSNKKRKLKRIRRRSIKYGWLYIQYAVIGGIGKNILHLVKKHLLVPDEGVLWNRKVTAFCADLMAKRKIPYVLTTSPANSTHLIGVDLKRRFDIRWCADFRDAWIGNPMFKARSERRNRKEEDQERRILEAADVVTSVNDPIVALLKGHAKEKDGSRFATIYNGFDPDDLDVPAHTYDSNAINIIHCGVLFPQRTLGPFLRVATEMVDQGKPFRIYLLGRVEDQPCFEYQERYPEAVRILGVASHGKTISMIKGSDVTLVVQSDFFFAPLSGKIFEYLACDKKVIGLVPEGVARDFIREFQMGWSCDLTDEGRIREILEEVYLQWKERRLWIHYPYEIKRRFDRKVSTEKIAELLLRQEEVRP